MLRLTHSVLAMSTTQTSEGVCHMYSGTVYVKLGSMAACAANCRGKYMIEHVQQHEKRGFSSGWKGEDHP